MTRKGKQFLFCVKPVPKPRSTIDMSPTRLFLTGLAKKIYCFFRPCCAGAQPFSCPGIGQSSPGRFPGLLFVCRIFGSEGVPRWFGWGSAIPAVSGRGDRVPGKGSGPPRWAQEMGGFSSGNERQSPSQRAKAPLRARKPRPNKNTRKPFIFQRTS